MGVAFRNLTNQELDIEITRTSEGFCRFCEVPLEPTDIEPDYETRYGGCRCCGYQMYVRMVDDEDGFQVPAIGTTGWPAGVGGVENVGKCQHVIAWDADNPDEVGYGFDDSEDA